MSDIPRKIKTSFSINADDLDWISSIKLNESSYNDEFLPDDFQERFETFLSNFDEVINGNKLQKELFHNDDRYDLFISHAYADMGDDVDKKLHRLFNSLNIRCFIDSLMWQSSRDALKVLNIKHSDYNSYKNSYSHEKCKKASEHINTLLALTITEAINRSKAVMFINTPKSLSAKEYVGSDATFSPWLNYELQMLNLLPQTYNPAELAPSSEKSSIVSECLQFLPVSYKVKIPPHLSSSFADIYKQCRTKVLSGNDALNLILSYKANLKD